MVEMMNRSIDLLEELAGDSGNAFGLNRRGYLFVTADGARLEDMRASAEATSLLGGGPLRVHGAGGGSGYRPAEPRGFLDAPDGADLFLDGTALRAVFPYLSERVVGGLHVRRAGWLSAQQLGAWMLDRAREAGCGLVRRRVVGVRTRGGRVTGVELDDGTRIATGALVDAAGPMLGEVGRMMGEDLPLRLEVHAKVGFPDRAGVVSREAPMLIWSDPQRIDWDPDERRMLAAEGRSDLLGELPSACHGRPEGGPGSPWVLGLWEYRREVREAPSWPLPADPLYPEVVLRGLSTMIPGLRRYREALPTPVVDGGYYTKTPENRPLVGPLSPRGGFVAGALSGFGVMAACGVGELAALHVAAGALPSYAGAFVPARYEDPTYLRGLSADTDSGQL